MTESTVQALHQAELVEDARAVLNEEFSITTRSSADESMVLAGVDVLDVMNVLRNCNKVTMNFAKWPCAEYHGSNQDGVPLVVVAVIHRQEKVVKILKVWKG